MTFADIVIRPVAYIIYLERKRAGDPNADNEKENWDRAIERLKKEDFRSIMDLKLQHNYIQRYQE